jgi:hypothetical protein
MLGCVILWLWPCGILLDLQRPQGSQCIAALQHFYVALQYNLCPIPAGIGADAPIH